MIRKIRAVVSIIVLSVILLPEKFIMAQTTFVDNPGLPGGHITDIIIAIMNWLLGIVGVIGIIGFVIAGILYLTAAGNDDQIGTAKKAMMWSIVGVVVALMGYVMIQAIDLMLGGSNSSF